jgi:hypothetical protein
MEAPSRAWTVKAMCCRRILLSLRRQCSCRAHYGALVVLGEAFRVKPVLASTVKKGSKDPRTGFAVSSSPCFSPLIWLQRKLAEQTRQQFVAT